MKLLALLRGINVAGQKKVPMQQLKAVFENLGFQQVSTYIQSGNVLFENPDYHHDSLLAQLEQAIQDEFKFEVKLILLNAKELRAALSLQPFLAQAQNDTAALYYSFLAAQPLPENLSRLEGYKFDNEYHAVVGTTCYLYCPKGYGTSKLSNNFIEAKLKVLATTRNYKTVNHLLGLLEA